MCTGQKGAPRRVAEVLRVNSRGPSALLLLLGTLESRLWLVGLQYIAAPDAIRSDQVDLPLLRGKQGRSLPPSNIPFIQHGAIANKQSIFGGLMDQQIRSGGRPQSGQRRCPPQRIIHGNS